MEDINEIVDKLKHSPHLKIIMQKIDESLREERERRQAFYELIHENVKAEFINGDIVYQSPVKQSHWNASANISATLIQFVKNNNLGKIAVEKAMISLSRNDYEPDICFWRKEVADSFTADQMHFPAPDFIIEIISPSTEHIDRNEKLIDYAAHQVKEYWIVDPQKQTVEKFLEQNGVYELAEKLQQGRISSHTIQGFQMELNDIFAS